MTIHRFSRSNRPRKNIRNCRNFLQTLIISATDSVRHVWRILLPQYKRVTDERYPRKFLAVVQWCWQSLFILFQRPSAAPLVQLCISLSSSYVINRINRLENCFVALHAWGFLHFISWTTWNCSAWHSAALSFSLTSPASTSRARYLHRLIPSSLRHPGRRLTYLRTNTW